MKRLVWLTDVHLDFVDGPSRQAFYEAVRAQQPAAVLLGGDIAEAPTVADLLRELDDALQTPIHFVLGNHDFYHGSIAGVRQQMQALCRERPRLNYLTQGDVTPLGDWGLVGHDGWADARVGDYEKSYVMMHDYRLIEELRGVDKEHRWPLLRALGDEAAEHVQRVLPPALERFRQVVLLTHVPPLREACWHNGQISDDEWAPHFVCLAVGRVIHRVMRQHPDRRLTVLCGHTHGEGQSHPLPNVQILTGGAVYGRPAVTQVFPWGGCAGDAGPRDGGLTRSPAPRPET